MLTDCTLSTDGLEKLRYHACKIFAITVTPGSLPSNIWLHLLYLYLLLARLLL